ncbi:hypothetical protein EI94DRAFT_1774217 [Lactarius quietus]|nr:hypothetical protein EI94DRAFT_1774217 [Lactarius quietus]
MSLRSPHPQNASSRASMRPSARPSPAQGFSLASPRPGGGPPSGLPTSGLLGSSTFQTQKNFHHFEVTLEIAIASHDVNYKEELAAIEQCEVQTSLRGHGRTAALYRLSHSTQVQIRFFITVLQRVARADPMTDLLSPTSGGYMHSPSARTFNASATNCHSLAFDSSSSSLSPDAANNVGNPSDAAATLTKQRAKVKAAKKTSPRISALALASAVTERDDSPTQDISVVEPRPHSSSDSSDVNNGVSDNGIYGDDGDLISGQHAPGCGCVPSASLRSSRGLRNGGRFGGSNDGSNAMEAAHRQAALAPRHGRIQSRINLSRTRPFSANMNMLGMTNLSVMAISLEAQLLAAQIGAAGGGFGLPCLGLGAGLGWFGEGGVQSGGMRGGPGRSRQCERQSGGGGSAGSGNSAKKTDEEDFDPAVLNYVAGWLFEGMTWKEMVVMDEQALKAQGVSTLGARRKMLKTFEASRRKMSIDDLPAPLPPGPLDWWWAALCVILRST